MKKNRFISFSILSTILLFISASLYRFQKTFIHNFGKTTLEQLQLHYHMYQQNLLFSTLAEKSILRRFYTKCIEQPLVFSLIISASIFLILYILSRNNIISVMHIKKTKRSLIGIYCILCAFSTYHLKNIFDEKTITLTNHKSSFIRNHYYNNENIVAPTHKKNLVLIYVESLENAYSDKSLFHEDLLASLKNIPNSISFKNLHKTYGATWSIAGHVATQCGIPLKPVSQYLKENSLGALNKFLPNAECLGDILGGFGYKNLALETTPVKFAGFKNFYQTHHFSKILGKQHWLDIGLKASAQWGISDNSLYNQAKKFIDKLEHRQHPYSLVIITADTHGLEGNFNSSCRTIFHKNIFTNIVKCTARETRDFINYVIDKGYLNNTNIVVLGDHLAMKNTVSNLIEKSPSRTVFNLFSTSSPVKKNRESINAFDLYPTILYSLGFRFKENRLALGASGFGEINEQQLIDNIPDVNKKLSYYSDFYLQLWGDKLHNMVTTENHN